MSQALPREWFGASIRNDGLRRDKARPRVRFIAVYLLVVSMPISALLFYNLQGVQVIRTGYEIDRLRREHQVYRTEKDRFTVELASLQNLAVVEKLAVRELGMLLPEPEHLVVVREVPAGKRPAAGPEDGTEKNLPRKSRLLAFLHRVTRAL